MRLRRCEVLKGVSNEDFEKGLFGKICIEATSQGAALLHKIGCHEDCLRLIGSFFFLLLAANVVPTSTSQAINFLSYHKLHSIVIFSAHHHLYL